MFTIAYGRHSYSNRHRQDAGCGLADVVFRHTLLFKVFLTGRVINVKNFSASSEMIS